MIEPDLSLQKPLEDYVEFFEKLNSRSVFLLSDMSDALLSFQDPYHNIKGSADVIRVFEARLKLCGDAHYKVSDFMWGRRAATAYIYWGFRFQHKKKVLRKSPTETYLIEGMSELKFTPDGKIFSIAEFWGAHDDFNVNAYQQALITK